jgi:hypothetical protein
MGLAPFVQRVLRASAERDSAAAAVMLEINTFGGRVDAAVAIRDALLARRCRRWPSSTDGRSRPARSSAWRPRAS